jgi:two-component system, OmpR family, sensor histidine kinase KdpD
MKSMDEERPDPEALLQAIMRDEKRKQSGRLKIFFGMSAGVGKTYAMLENAQRLMREGIDVVVGIVNTHGRKETAELLKGLRVVPEKWITYKEAVFEELDIDEILRIKPQVALIDELAHTNVPGSRHPKRWQDVLEILDAGIDVYTTLNVQHVESRKDVVESITGIQIRETVPDLVLERALEIELIDITPDELLHRLQEGKVYLGDQSLVAMQNFFKEHSLIALREIALRFTAEKVDHDLHGMHKEWRTRERLMVAVSHSPHSQQIIRTARRLAFEVDAPWVAVHIDTEVVLSNQDQANLASNLNLARDLGAEVITVTDTDIASGLQRIAKQKNITQILVGRPSKRSFWDLFRQNFIDILIRNNPNIDVVVLRQDAVSGTFFKIYPIRPKFGPLMEYAISVLSVMIATLLGFILMPWLEYRGIGVIFLLNILFLSLTVSQGPILLSALLSSLFWDFLFVPPVLSLTIHRAEDVELLFIYFLIASVMGFLSSRVKEKERLLTIREENSEFLFEIEKDIATATSIQHLRIAIANRLKKMFKGDFDILVKNLEDQLIIDSSLKMLQEEKERVVALWVFKNDKIAGWSTDTLPAAVGIYFPIRGFGETVGVFAYQPKYPRPLTISEMNFLQTVNQQVGVYVQRALTREKARSNEYTREVEKAQSAIFHSFSYNINIPIVQISQLIEELKNEQVDEKRRAHLIKQIERGLINLKELVSNILTMSKLSSGFMHFVKTKQDIRHLIDAVLEKIKSLPEQRRIEISIPKHMPLVAFDKPLMEIALNNLIINALEYSPFPKPIRITVGVRKKEAVLSVSDEGPGIPDKILPYIFEKFYQAEVPGAESTGLGLGLAVTKAIVELHHGQLEARNREERGAEFSLILPLQ